MGPNYWSNIEDNHAIGEKAYIRTNESCNSAPDADLKVYRLKIQQEPAPEPNPDMLIQSQQVTLTGTERQVRRVLAIMRLAASFEDLTVTLTPTSVPDATVGVTQDSQQNPQHWISVEERLPEEKNRRVFWYVPNYYTRYDKPVPSIRCAWSSSTDMRKRASHWMYVPTSPDTQGCTNDAKRHEDFVEKDRAEAEKFADWLIEIVNADQHDVISFNRDIGCRVRDHIEYLRRQCASTDAQGSVTAQSQQKSRQDGE